MKQYETEGIGRYISYLHRLGANFLSKEYDQYEIGFGQYQFLLRLYLEDGVSHDELTEQVCVDKATTTRAIKKLEEKGYVRLAPNEKDKRKYHIYLTEKALMQKEEILEISRRWERQLIDGLEQEELNQLFYLLRKITRYNSGYLFNEE
ncbi:MarR family winged helix-turn-helix transcriptional regulator [Cellulosilyticum lentocellum]|uniref:Transcriptional regulator, MarR family n=1 Tax=Cellulosilyticum lentocellum (strain ATCC 49066 / DSM 5427 / NCIMB 11756 / RHM5) TaxID=642492 RepID=F2JKB1_CELLD|nr:MarR family transcriptional regulator [Cellulosilyticum lentocellum]ADZ85626.1 transcriptional regulator, MarR family [Cellulosilyticum lentocellum DSM 5427]